MHHIAIFLKSYLREHTSKPDNYICVTIPPIFFKIISSPYMFDHGFTSLLQGNVYANHLMIYANNAITITFLLTI